MLLAVGCQRLDGEVFLQAIAAFRAEGNCVGGGLMVTMSWRSSAVAGKPAAVERILVSWKWLKREASKPPRMRKMALYEPSGNLGGLTLLFLEIICFHTAALAVAAMASLRSES